MHQLKLKEHTGSQDRKVRTTEVAAAAAAI